MSANDNTPASFSTATGGKSQLLIAQGYDHNWMLNKQTGQTTGPDGLNLAARASDPGSGRDADRLDRPAGRPVLQRQLPHRHADRHLR